ncbi:mitogen-activated protein kinase 15 [Micropterus salmoides]|uniref:mitogen-activated protein kinase 15 n=1 Tax=Micropterus salmoides TaxID=27706 RepID=UPI0018EC6F22|nr:mitogen-activated protein kinase 15 [Micropterus salmoides]XP_038581043.1 mitogen-activated protein kinase 15 [Micropterus salmoides]XP_038581044.1 mitogen-activated protein kinase 15 [Micropterus salmoides]XP_038581046.1 mitogen-activated protein kinase 15 [Micropterus salmoides]XP_038581047.1 mitogen-activated protein kinase 15 [Micropterus salmoides]
MSKKYESANVSELEEHISLKYEIKKRLGKGAYGIVWKAVDRQTGEIVAVKKIFDAFRNRTDAQRTFREIMFLQEFGDHPNIVRLLNVVRAQNDKDIYLIFEYMDTDLHAVIKKGTLLKDIHKRYVMYQLLKAIKYLHSGNVIHRDQKPSNVLLDTDCVVKLCDFGLARSLNQIQEDSGNPALTEYVATRWYRAPEILLGSTRYTKGVDMWSLGCILGEMLLGKALFPGTSTINQIEKIMSAIQHPSTEDILAIKSEYGSSVIQRMLLKPQVPLEDLLQPSVPPDALDLLRGLLVFNPDKRLTAEQALQHAYVARFHSPAKEPALNYDVVLPVDDDVQLSVVQYRNKLYEMMLERRTNQGMLRLIQPKGGGGGSGREKPNVKDKVEKCPVTVNGSGDCDHEGKTQHEKTDETNHVPSPTGVTNPGPVNASTPPAVENPVPTPGLGKLTYNPITHAPNGFVRSPSGPTHFYHSTAASRRLVEQTGNGTTSPTEGTKANVSMDQILQRGRSAPMTHNRSFSLTLNQTQNNPLVRKDEPSLSSGLCVTSARLNQRSNSQVREARPPPRFSKKVFQSNCNVAAAGDPRAKLGSYTQAYGTINKTDLDNLLRRHPYNQ